MPSVLSSPRQYNYFSVTLRLHMEVGRDILWELFQWKCGYNFDYVQAQEMIANSRNLRAPPEFSEICARYKDGDRLVNTDFDVLLLFFLISNFTDYMSSPYMSHGNDPTGISISADIKQLRYWRNGIAHSRNVFMSEEEYTRHLIEVESVYARFDQHLSSVGQQPSFVDRLTNIDLDLKTQQMEVELLHPQRDQTWPGEAINGHTESMAEEIYVRNGNTCLSDISSLHEGIQRCFDMDLMSSEVQELNQNIQMNLDRLVVDLEMLAEQHTGDAIESLMEEFNDDTLFADQPETETRSVHGAVEYLVEQLGNSNDPVFLSFAPDGSELVSRIIKPNLKSRGIDVIIPDEDFDQTKSMLEEYGKAVDTTGLSVILLTEEYMQDQECNDVFIQSSLLPRLMYDKFPKENVLILNATHRPLPKDLLMLYNRTINIDIYIYI